MPSQPTKRESATERRAKNKAANPFMTTSASQRRTQKRLTEGKSPTASDGTLPAHMSHEQVAYLLEHPTRDVPTEELQKEYGFVLTDIRNMFLVAGGLILLEIILALILPK